MGKIEPQLNKSEIRLSKSETNTKHKTQVTEAAGVLNFLPLDF